MVNGMQLMNARRGWGGIVKNHSSFPHIHERSTVIGCCQDQPQYQDQVVKIKSV